MEEKQQTDETDEKDQHSSLFCFSIVDTNDLKASLDPEAHADQMVGTYESRWESLFVAMVANVVATAALNSIAGVRLFLACAIGNLLFSPDEQRSIFCSILPIFFLFPSPSPLFPCSMPQKYPSTWCLWRLFFFSLSFRLACRTHTVWDDSLCHRSSNATNTRPHSREWDYRWRYQDKREREREMKDISALVNRQIDLCSASAHR